MKTFSIGIHVHSAYMWAKSFAWANGWRPTNLQAISAASVDGGNPPHVHCHASHGDGECFWQDCPQLKKYRYHCPLDLECIELKCWDDE